MNREKAIQIDSEIQSLIEGLARDHGYRQMCGYSSDALWITDDEKLGVNVHAGCVHPALGEDITARVAQSEGASGSSR